jgi:hypothetical protein
MSNEVGEADGLPAAPVPGAVRFGEGGRLEMFDGATWAPLLRVSDADLPPIMREVNPLSPAVPISPSAPDETDDPDSPASS